MSTCYYKLRRYEVGTDIKDIYRVFSNYAEQYKLFSVMNTNSYEEFKRSFENKLFSNYKDFLIIDVDNCFAGFVASYDYKIIDAHIKGMIYIEPEYRSGFVGMAGIEFANILFQYYNIRKIYTEVYAYNQFSIAYHEKIGFTEECRLKEYKYFDGKFWDVIYYQISRDLFYKKNQPFIKRFLENNKV